jgi:hypothetical protein
VSDAKVLRWARLIQPLILVGFALHNRRNLPNHVKPRIGEDTIPDPSGGGLGKGLSYGYMTGNGGGYGKDTGHYSGNGGSRGGR